MSIRMTGLGQYQEGIRLEAEGLSGAEIAKRLRYKDTQAWYAAKSYYTRKEQAFNARAAGQTFEVPPAPAPEKPKLIYDDEIVEKDAACEQTAETIGKVACRKPDGEALTRVLETAARQAEKLAAPSRAQAKSKAKPKAPAKPRKPAKISKDTGKQLDAYAAPGTEPAPLEAAERVTPKRVLRPISTIMQGAFGRYTVDQDGKRVAIEVPGQKEALCLVLNDVELKAFLTELFALTAMMEAV